MISRSIPCCAPETWVQRCEFYPFGVPVLISTGNPILVIVPCFANVARRVSSVAVGAILRRNRVFILAKVRIVVRRGELIMFVYVLGVV